MGKRSGAIDHEQQAAKPGLAKRDNEIARCKMRR
jgi:hypothetical protein